MKESYEQVWRERMANYAPAATEADWQAMQRLLPPTRRGSGWRWLAAAMGMLILVVLTYSIWFSRPVPESVAFPVVVPPVGLTPGRVEALPSPNKSLVLPTPVRVLPKAVVTNVPRNVSAAPPARPPQMLTTWATESLPQLPLGVLRSADPSLAEHLEAAGKTLIVVPVPNKGSGQKVDNGFYPPFRKHH